MASLIVLASLAALAGQSASPADVLEWNEKRAVELSALPLSCLDRPHRAARGRSYVYEVTQTLRPDYESALAFYGCYDWHSAVNSTWTLVKVLKDFPNAAVASLIREKLEGHLSEKTIEGEVRFFADVARPGFERPYGWAWLMKLYVELASWDDPDGERWARNVEPLAKLLAERTLEYLDHLAHPLRIGTHNNTAFSLELVREFALLAGDDVLVEAIDRRAREFFANDTDCPIEYEPSGSDFLSPCLSEAVLMSRVVDAEAFPSWLQAFLPSVDPLRELPTMRDHYLDVPTETPVVTEATSKDETQSAGDESQADEPDDDGERAEERRLAGARSHLIGLAFVRARDLLALARALPENDARRETYFEVAALSARHGFERMYDASYFGSHWLASFAVRMLAEAAP